MRTPTAEFITRTATAKYLAKDRKAHLDNCLNAGTIDTFFQSQYRYCAVAQTANQGDKGATQFLLSQGAKIHYAILGIAQSGDEAWLFETLQCFPHLIDIATEGAALGGHEKLANTLVKRGGNPTAMLKGAARGAHWVWVDAILGKQPTAQQASLAAFGAALHQDWDRMIKYQRDGGNLRIIAEGIGIAGHWHQGQQLIEKNPQVPELAHHLALGFAAGGHEGKAQRMFSHKASPYFVGYGAALSGNTRWCTQLLKTSHQYLEPILIGASAGGHHEWAEKLRARAESVYDIPHMPCITQMAKVAQEYGFSGYADHLKRVAPNAFPASKLAPTPLPQQPKKQKTEAADGVSQQQHQSHPAPRPLTASSFSLSSSSVSTFTLSEASFHLEDSPKHPATPTPCPVAPG